jgi:signal transduction histidine kinase
MLFQPILALLILRHLRKSLHTDTLMPKWDLLFKAGTGISIAMIVLYATVKDSRQILTWSSDIFLFALAYLVYFQKEFRSVRSALNAFLPIILIYLFEDIIVVVNTGFHTTWRNYFEAAKMFGLIWMVAILIINNRQRKALEKERLKTEEKEKENRITAALKAELEVQVKERTAELTLQKEELQEALNELKATQSQLIQSEKMASLGELTAGIAHEIQNPLNFVNNFSEVSKELLDEMKTALDSGNTADAKDIAGDVIQNLEKINHHGKRADAIVKGMLQHSRSSSSLKEPADINALCDEYLRLSYHGLRAKDKSFNAAMKTDFDASLGNINIIPQDIGRAILNLLTNAFYAVTEKKHASANSAGQSYEPTVSVSTKKEGDKVIISVKDNGNGIPPKVLDKIFHPFFTTKPTGQGTGLGLSLSYDIITKGHGGELKVKTKDGEGAEFIIILPA